MSFGKNLQNLRKELGLEREEFAQSLNITYASLAKYETDKRFPPADVLLDIANYFDVSIDYLLDREPKPFLDPRQKKLLSKFDSLEEDNKQLVLDFIDLLLNKAKVK